MINRFGSCLVVSVLAGCGSTNSLSTAGSQPPYGPKESAQLSTATTCPCLPADANTTRALLNPGYAQLAAILNGLAWTDEILLVKLESDEVEVIGEALAAMASSFAEELETLAAGNENISLEDDGFPPIEKRKQQAMLQQWMQDYLPLVGMDGMAFERTLLLRSVGAMNQIQYLSQVMQEDEPIDQMNEYLQRIQKESKRIHALMLEALESRYFVADRSD